MLNKEFEPGLTVSPENYTHGRVDAVRISQADNIDEGLAGNTNNIEVKSPELEARLKNDSRNERVVFARERKSARNSSKFEWPDISPWEPFNLEPTPNQRFINLYDGPFSQQMELNRANADRLLDVAAIQGRVMLTNVPMDRNRGIAGVNADGSVTKRRGLFWGEEIEEDGSKALVKPIPEGWKIEIPGEEILDRLSRQESKTPLDRRFTAKFNQVIRDSMRKIIFREKLTNQKDNLQYKIIWTTAPWWGFLGVSLPTRSFNTISIMIPFMLSALYYPIAHLSKSREKQSSSLYEYFLPPLEIDRVLRGMAFANLKGRNLVRLKEEDA
ncbi:MAG: hypothetical protein HYT08_04350 [Candidatus Levybacteria bacterium]|nr:hypothetical protein [Candidatus Levybacteria bacterium]